MNAVVSVVPSNLQLPAHLQSPDIAAAIAAANAAAAGGVRAGGFPTIGIKANKFSIKDGDETTVLMMPPAAPGQPSLPMMCLEVVIIDANPALSHTYFEGDFVEGEHLEPACRSGNGVTPDADVAVKQSVMCATCPQYQWGSKISKLTGKPVRACGDSKQLAVVPANDLNYKMLGMQIKAGSLKNWGNYIHALSGRGYGVSTLVTNITFDQTANGVLQFTYNRFLSEAEFNAVNQRKTGDDVKMIVAQSRGMAAAPALPAPAANLGLPAPEVAAPVYTAPVAPPPPATGFGAAPAPTPAPESAPTAAEPAKRSRRTRAEMEAAKPADPHPEAVVPSFAHIPADIMATINAVGITSAAGQALIAAYPPPSATAPVATPQPQAAPASAPPPVDAAPAAVAPTTGFGAAPAAPVQQAPTAQVVASGPSLADKLRAKLGVAAGA